MGWLTDKINPATEGELGGDAQPRILVLIKVVISVGIVGSLYFLVYHYRTWLDTWPMILAIIGIPVYCALSFFFRPDPDQYGMRFYRRGTDKSDVIAWLIITWPGRFVAQTAVDLAVLIRFACLRPSDPP